jgi:hypothetical protein
MAGAKTQFMLALEIDPDGVEALAGLQQTAVTPAGIPSTTEPTPEATGAVEPTAVPTTVPTVEPVGEATSHPYLVRPAGWPTNMPWPPTQQ